MKIITITREYGAGGHSIGMKVAEKLGIEFYDRDIIRETARLSGISEDDIREEEEQVSKGEAFIRSITPISFDFKDTIYDYQRKVIIGLAEKGEPCVILGRCAGSILEKEGIDCLNIFLYADEAHRAVRVGQLIESDDMGDIVHAMKKTDAARRSYYNYYTGSEWGKCGDFDMVLDTGLLGYEKCIDLICLAASEK